MKKKKTGKEMSVNLKSTGLAENKYLQIFAKHGCAF